MIYIGSHVGMKAPNYILGSIEEALSYNATAAMFYTGAPQNTKRKAISELKVNEAKALLDQEGWSMNQIVIHAPYIINLANSTKPETYDFGKQFLKEELKRVHEIGAKLLVLHPGSHLKAGVETGIEYISNALNEIFEEDDTDVMIALETMAGKGSEVGRSFEEIRSIMDAVDQSERLGVCLDTCHIHDAGYDLHHFDDILDEFDRIIGLEHLKVLHINDSKNVMGAKKDRHANLGQGEIGFDLLYSIVHNPRLDGLVMILETPYIDEKPPYKEEIEMLRTGLWQNLMPEEEEDEKADEKAD